jgi:hypothetical protein
MALITLIDDLAYNVSVLGALLGTQNGREVEIVNTFELATEGNGEAVDHGFLVSRRDQCEPLLKSRMVLVITDAAQISRYSLHSSLSAGTPWHNTQPPAILLFMNR